MPKAIPKKRKSASKVSVPAAHDPNKTYATEALERVMRIYTAENYRDRTMLDYRTYFEEFIEVVGVTYMDDVTADDIRAYLAELLKTRGYSPVTVNIRLSSLRAVINRMHREGIIAHNPVAAVQKVKEDERLPKILNHSQVRQLFAVVEKDTYVGFRDYCMMLIALKCGLRSNEIERLEIADVDFDNEVLMLPGAINKNRKNRPVPMSRSVKANLRQLITETRDYFGDRVKSLFVTQFGEQVQPRTFGKRLYRYARSAGFQGIVSASPHVLRHTFAVNFLNSPYGNIRALQKILGHSNLSTTEVYLDYTNDAVSEQYRKVEQYDDLHV